MQIQTQKTTVELDRQLLSLAKIQAIREGKTLRDIIAEGLKTKLRLQNKQPIKSKEKGGKIGGHRLGGVIGSLRRVDLYEEF